MKTKMTMQTTTLTMAKTTTLATWAMTVAVVMVRRPRLSLSYSSRMLMSADVGLLRRV